MSTVELNVLLYEEGDLWVAQAIEADIVATADRLTNLPRAFERALIANLSANKKLGRFGLDGIPAAPLEFREKFERSGLAIQDLHRNDSNEKRAERFNMRLLAA